MFYEATRGSVRLAVCNMQQLTGQRGSEREEPVALRYLESTESNTESNCRAMTGTILLVAFPDPRP